MADERVSRSAGASERTRRVLGGRLARVSLSCVLIVLAIAGLLASNGSAGSSLSSHNATRGWAFRPDAAVISPERFAEVSSGVVLIHTFTCSGRLTGAGSGFLIGDRIVMTARHVVDPPEGRQACITKVRVKGQWIVVADWNWWYNNKPADGRIVDLAVMKLNHRVDAYLFRIRGRPAPIGTNLAALGHPLGNQLSVTQGKLVARKRYQGIPLIFVRLLGAEGASGSAYVDNDGKVVGLLQFGLGAEAGDILGQHTAGVVGGLDLNSWWGNGKKWLCKNYPDGGIPMCGAPSAPPPSSPPPAQPPSPPPTPTGTASFLDTTGEAGAAPDIQKLTTQLNSSGLLEIRITLAAPLGNLQTVDVDLNLDSDPMYEDAYFVANATQWDYGRWNGSSWDDQPPASASAALEDAGRTIRFSIAPSDLGNPATIGLLAAAFQYATDNTTVVARDDLPDGGWETRPRPWFVVKLR